MTFRRKKVIHVLASLDYGGVERRMEIVSSTERYSEFDHCFCVIGEGGAVERSIRRRGGNVYCLHATAKIPNVRLLLSLFRLFVSKRPDVVHAHGAEANFHSLISAWLANVSVRIGEEIGIPSHSQRAKFIFRQIYRLAHHVVAISDSVKQWLVDNREVAPERAVRIYNPVSIPDIDIHRALDSNQFRIGFVGRLEKVKNPIVLLDALPDLLAWGIPAQLWLIGDGSQRAELEAHAGQLGITDNVTFWGYQEEPSLLVSRCHLYVQPSLSEGFGIALVEAMMCGVPVIATAVGGAPEIVDQGRTGWLVDMSDDRELTDALLGAWELGEERLDDIGKNAKAAVATRFSPEQYVLELEALYASCLRNNTRKILGYDNE